MFVNVYLSLRYYVRMSFYLVEWMQSYVIIKQIHRQTQLGPSHDKQNSSAWEPFAAGQNTEFSASFQLRNTEY